MRIAPFLPVGCTNSVMLDLQDILPPAPRRRRRRICMPGRGDHDCVLSASRGLSGAHRLLAPHSPGQDPRHSKNVDCPVRAMTRAAPGRRVLSLYIRADWRSSLRVLRRGVRKARRWARGSQSAARQSWTTSRSARSPRVGSTARTIPATPPITIGFAELERLLPRQVAGCDELLPAAQLR